MAILKIEDMMYLIKKVNLIVDQYEDTHTHISFDANKIEFEIMMRMYGADIDTYGLDDLWKNKDFHRNVKNNTKILNAILNAFRAHHLILDLKMDNNYSRNNGVAILKFSIDLHKVWNIDSKICGIDELNKGNK